MRLNFAHGEAVAQTSPGINFAPNVAPQVRPRRGAGLGGFPPALVDALLDKPAVRDVLRGRVRNTREHEEGKELCPIDILDEVLQRSGNRDVLLGCCVRYKVSTRNAEVCVMSLES